MKKLIFSFLIFALFAVTFVHANAADEMKESLVGYLKSFLVKETKDELKAKPLPELIDMAIAVLKKDKSQEPDPEQQAILQKHIEYHEDLKANLAERTKDFTRPITDPNHVSKVHHVDSGEDFDNQMKNAGDKLVIVDFFATWCGPCKSLAPYLPAFADKYESQVFFMKVDVDEHEELASGRFGVTSMPTIMYFKNGQIVEKYSDSNSERMEDTIKKFIN